MKCLAAVLFSFLLTLHAHAASISVNSVGKGTYILQGNNMDGVAGLDLKITYPTTLSSPTVTQGSLISGALMMPNTTMRGIINIAIISTNPFSGSGPVATISFKSYGAKADAISVSTKLIASTGATISADSSTIVDEQGAGKGKGTADSIQKNSPVQSPTLPSTPPAVTKTIAGTINVSTEQPAKVQAVPKDSPPPPEPAALPASAAPRESVPPVQEKQQPEPEKPAPPASIMHKAVIEHFQSLTGERTPASCSALFTKQLSSSISQEPPIAISDGITPVTIVVKLDSSKKDSPNFALSNAKLISINKQDTTWIIKTIPSAKTLQAGLTILSSDTMTEFPLTLVPPVDGISSTEADFTAFLKDSGVTPPKRDLNGDGIHDYQDDYIYTAHYLIRKSAATVEALPAVPDTKEITR